jgi:hypothetical protein
MPGDRIPLMLNLYWSHDAKYGFCGGVDKGEMLPKKIDE